MRNLVISNVRNDRLAVEVGGFPGATMDEDEFFISVYGGSTNPVFKFDLGRVVLKDGKALFIPDKNLGQRNGEGMSNEEKARYMLCEQ